MTTQSDNPREINRSNDPLWRATVSAGAREALARSMEDLNEDFGPLVARLQTLGRQPVPDSVQRVHMAAMQRVCLEAPSRIHDPVDVAAVIRVRFRRVRVIAASVGVAVLGTSGLAAAGALPPAAQDIASEALGTIGLDVPRGTPLCDGSGSVADECVDAPAEGD